MLRGAPSAGRRRQARPEPATPWPRWRWGALLLVPAFGLHCSELPRPYQCGLIPEGGCPVGRGGSCDDTTCLALYACDATGWQLVESCPPQGEGGSTGEAGAGGAAGAGALGHGGSTACAPAALDHSGEKNGCDVDLLEHYDCTVEAAETCHPCLTGCADFFMCMEDGGGLAWVHVAYCTEEGELVVVQ